MRGPAVLLALLALAAVAAADPPPDVARFRTEIAAEIDAWIARYHEDPADLDRARIVEEAVERLRKGETRSQIADWLHLRLSDAYLSFAPLDARHDHRVRYRLPFPIEVPRYLAQGVGGRMSHSDSANYFAFDFALPVGTPVLAARDGVVGHVTDGFETASLDKKLSYRSNGVKILHDDGTFASYGHLRKGIPAQRGTRVRAGDVIAYSGYTGYASAPHLHFSVLTHLEGGRLQSLPIRFGTRAGWVPQQGSYYGAPARTAAALRVSVAGRVVGEGDVTPLRQGGSAPLAVEWIGPGGATRDVTRDAHTRFESVTLWSLDVDAAGVVTARPTPGFEAMEAPRRFGSAVVLHGRPGQPRFGFAQVWFEIQPVKPASPGNPTR